MPDRMVPADASGIEHERIAILNNRRHTKGDYVLYWMQQSQRAHWNHALEFAVSRANKMHLPVVVLFAITDQFPEANLRHYTFMLEGLFNTALDLEKRFIKFILRRGDPAQTALEIGENAAEIVCDRGYTRIQRQWRQSVAENAVCPVFCVESDAVVPVETVSKKAEYAARTIRPKIQHHLERFVHPVTQEIVGQPSLTLKINGLDLSDPYKIAAHLNIDISVFPVTRFFKGGNTAARSLLDVFLTDPITRYVQNSNQPQTDDTSKMSPYLHFGQISPVYLAWKVRTIKGLDSDIRDSFLEELIVRRELAANFVYFTADYDSYSCLPQWATKTLNDHRHDKRDPIYSMAELEQSTTHDPYWNAAMDEMKFTGFMHNYMRMYWGKKILEWSKDPETAFQNALALNNRYFLDGRDPNSFAGVGWIFGLHDRAWKERDIFGKVRYMNAAGLKRKCDINGYVKKVAQMKHIANRSSKPNNP